jgi:hypothetical protein
VAVPIKLSRNHGHGWPLHPHPAATFAVCTQVHQAHKIAMAALKFELQFEFEQHNHNLIFFI